MTNTDPKPHSIREFIASSSNPAFQEQIKAACAQRGISLDSPWPLPLTKSAAVAEPEQPAPAPESAPRRKGRVAQPKSSDQAATPDKKPRSKRQQRQAEQASNSHFESRRCWLPRHFGRDAEIQRPGMAIFGLALSLNQVLSTNGELPSRPKIPASMPE